MNEKYDESDQKFRSFLKIYHQVVEAIEVFQPNNNLLVPPLNKFKKSNRNENDSQTSRSKRSHK